MAAFPITEHVTRAGGHTTQYLSCGDPKGPLLVFVHGWPELSLSWRHQLHAFGALGFHAVAPDMRGYGGSTVHPKTSDYTVQAIEGDMLALLDHLGPERAVWVGHDWGANITWSLARHHPERVLGVANLCVPYIPGGFTPARLIALADRVLYPKESFPAAQWDYQLFYEESFCRATAVFDADPVCTVKALFRKGDPAGRGKPGRLATIRRDGGWFGGADRAPDLPMDTELLTPEDLHRYASALARNGFFGPDAWYMNAAANEAYAATAAGDDLHMPALFLHGLYDYTCDTTGDVPLPGPMRAHCRDLTEGLLPTGHWMAQECPAGVNAHLARWLAQKLPGHWPYSARAM